MFLLIIEEKVGILVIFHYFPVKYFIIYTLIQEKKIHLTRLSYFLAVIFFKYRPCCRCHV